MEFSIFAYAVLGVSCFSSPLTYGVRAWKSNSVGQIARRLRRSKHLYPFVRLLFGQCCQMWNYKKLLLIIIIIVMCRYIWHGVLLFWITRHGLDKTKISFNIIRPTSLFLFSIQQNLDVRFSWQPSYFVQFIWQTYPPMNPLEFPESSKRNKCICSWMKSWQFRKSFPVPSIGTSHLRLFQFPHCSLLSMSSLPNRNMFTPSRNEFPSNGPSRSLDLYIYFYFRVFLLSK